MKFLPPRMAVRRDYIDLALVQSGMPAHRGPFLGPAEGPCASNNSLNCSPALDPHAPAEPFDDLIIVRQVHKVGSREPQGGFEGVQFPIVHLLGLVGR